MKKRRNPWYRIENAAKSDESTVYIYEEIDSFWGVSAQVFVKELAAIKASTIHVRINSPGGSFFDGMAIYNALRNHPAEIVAHVDGLAASAASLVALAGDRVVMGEGSFMMMHEAWGVAVGAGKDLREMADVLDKITGSINEIYARRSGKSTAQIAELLEAETWLDADEAVAEGFADETEAAKNVKAAFDLSSFKNTPRALLEEQKSSATPSTIREFEEFLRDGGFSNSAAKAIAAAGFKGATDEPREEAPAAIVEEILSQLALTSVKVSLINRG